MRLDDSPTSLPEPALPDSSSTTQDSTENCSADYSHRMCDSLPIGLFRMDKRGEVTYANRRTREIMGGMFRGPDSDGVGVVLHTDDCMRVRESWAKSLQDCTAFESAHRLVYSDGRIAWVDVQALPETNKGGELLGFLGTLIDVTKHRGANSKRNAAGDWFRNLTENTTDLTFILDAELTCRYVSPAVRRLDQKIPEQMLGQAIDSWIHPNDIEQTSRQLNRAVDTPGESVPITWFRLVGGDGQPVYIEGVAISSADHDGHIGIVFNGRDVTGRAQVEARLRERENLLHGIIEGTDDIIFVKDLDGRYLLANSADARGLGLTSEEMVGLRDSDVFPSEVAARMRQRDRQVIGSGTSITYEEIIERPDEIQRTYLISKYPYFDDYGQVIGVMGIARDITENKSSELALRNSEQSYRTLCENLTGLVYRISLAPPGRMVFFNQLLEPMTGYAADELTMGGVCKIDRLIVPEDRDAVIAVVQKAIDAREPFEVTYRLKRKNCEIVHFVERGRPVVDQDGRCTHIDGVIFDITARRSAEQALCESEQRYRSVAEDSPVLICRLLLDGTITYVNRAYCEYFGRSREQMIGKRIFELIPDELHERVASNLAGLSSDNPVMSHEHEVLAADGSRQWQRWTNRLLLDTDGKPVAFQAFGEDISEQRAAQEELFRYRVHLEELVEQRTRQLEESRAALIRSERLASIGTLSAGIAHEINNPIGMILLAAENAMVAVDRGRHDGFVSTCLRHIVDSARRCTDITRSVLRFARSEPAEKRIQDLNAVVLKAISYAYAYAEENHVAIHRSLIKGVVDVSMNAMEMQQVVANLLRNSVQAARGPATIEIRTETTDWAAWIVVQDNGPGIAQEHLPHLFDPFFTTRLDKGGTGLGLSIVHGIVTDHGGTIDVRSEVGAGTAFVIELPLAKRTENSPCAGS